MRVRCLRYGQRPPITPDGEIWFLPKDGVSVIDPRHRPFNKIPPPVQVEQVTADRKTYDPAAYGNGRVPLPARLRDVEIDYTALSFVAPEKVLFRYRLEGREIAIGRTRAIAGKRSIATCLPAATVFA